jgi:hypothetical protein
MATLSDLVAVVSKLTGLPEATVFAYGRFARQAGLIQQAGRGHNAASMTISDAANLLIAVAGTAVTREAGSAIETFRSLRNGIFYDWVPSAALMPGLEFLQHHGVSPREAGQPLRVQGSFGPFLEFLIESTLNGRLSEFFSKVPVAEIPSNLWAAWIREKSPNCDKTMEELVSEGLVSPVSRTELEFGEHINVEVTLSRLVPSVEIEFLRMWESVQCVAAITFGPKRGGQARGQHRLQLEATFDQHTLAAVGLVASGAERPSAFASLKPIERLFGGQFQKSGGAKDAKSR